MFKYTMALCVAEMVYRYKLDFLYDYKNVPGLDSYRRMPDFKGALLQPLHCRPYKDDGVIVVNDNADSIGRLHSEFDNRTIEHDGLHRVWRVVARFELGDMRYIGSISQVRASL